MKRPLRPGKALKLLRENGRRLHAKNRPEALAQAKEHKDDSEKRTLG